MGRILITGGTGFVGYWMAARKPAGLHIYRIGRAEYNTSVWLDMTWDGIIHLAPTSPKLVLDYAIRNHVRVLYASSGIVYYPDDPRPYKDNKVRFEKECINSGADVVIARLFTFFGKKLDCNKAITTFTEAARQNAPLIITGNGSTVRSYMHGSEMGDWLWAIYQHGATGEAYDVGSDTPKTMLELAVEIVNKYKSQSRIVILDGTDVCQKYLPRDTGKTKLLLQKHKSIV